MLIEGKIPTHIIKERNAESIQQDAKRETKKKGRRRQIHPHTRLTWNSPRCSLEAGGFRTVSEIRKCHTHLRSRRRVARSGREIRSPETDVKKRRKRGRGRRGSGCLFLSRWWVAGCVGVCLWLLYISMSVYLVVSLFSVYLSVYLCICHSIYQSMYVCGC